MLKQEKKTCEFCSASFIDDTKYNQIDCGKPECRRKYVEYIHGDHDNPKTCKFCERTYAPDNVDHGVCWDEPCQQLYAGERHAEAVAEFFEVKAELWETFKASPLAELPRLDFPDVINEHISYYRYMVAGCKHCEIDPLLVDQPEQYLSTLRWQAVHDVIATYKYFGNVVNEPGVPWVKPFYDELKKGKPAIVKIEPIQLQLEL